MSEQNDFWSKSIAQAVVEVPATIIREAARPLVERTRGLVEAEVKTGSDGASFLIHRIYLSAPTIGWKMRFAAFRHRAFPAYPVWADYEAGAESPYREGKPGKVFDNLLDMAGKSAVTDPPGERLGTSEELKAWLHHVLGSEEAATLVNAIIETLRPTAEAA